MIDTSAAIQQSGKKTIYIRRSNSMGMIVSDGKNVAGKWHIIDFCFGDTSQAVQDLRSQGYEIKTF